MVQEKLKVGILGATGTVGQRFILHLSDHPQFTLSVLGASSSSTDKTYQKATEGRWKQVKPIPDNVKEMVLKDCVPEHFKDCDIVFSGLDSGPAAVCEPSFRSSNLRVFSNAKNYRMDPLCPLVVPLVNPSHFSIIKTQQQSLTPSPSKGFIITNANCSTTGIVIPLKALMDKFGPLDKIMVSTMQAISGAGYPGVSSFDILGNVVPYISGEEEKIEMEVAKILGQIQTDKEGKGKEFKDHEVTVSASCNRVAVIDGHMECVSLSFKNRPPPGIEEVKQCLKDYVSEAQKLKVHSAPEIAIKVHEELDRPQPRLDVDFQNGAGVNVGRVRECKVLDVKFVVLSNNVQIGAATSSVMNAEIALSQGYLS